LKLIVVHNFTALYKIIMLIAIMSVH